MLLCLVLYSHSRTILSFFMLLFTNYSVNHLAWCSSTSCHIGVQLDLGAHHLSFCVWHEQIELSGVERNVHLFFHFVFFPVALSGVGMRIHCGWFSPLKLVAWTFLLNSMRMFIAQHLSITHSHVFKINSTVSFSLNATAFILSNSCYCNLFNSCTPNVSIRFHTYGTRYDNISFLKPLDCSVLPQWDSDYLWDFPRKSTCWPASDLRYSCGSLQ